LVAATGCQECEAAHAEIGYHGKYFCALFDHFPPQNPWKKKILARTKLLGRVWLEEVVGIRKETGA